ncbi:TspO/MBR family protein [Saccharopolyspora sp. ID03-671]|uniref:TspO/MBR family protein n=1 Tax=Saccharopolyspora sp. ID03-671 TaxID=3073066 RepID=UPI0032442C45
MRWRTLAGTGAAVVATAVVGAVAVESDSRWFRGLRKPRWQPPPPVFGPVWTALYADIAVASAAALSRLPRRSGYVPALAANLLLNAGWTWVFWGARSPRWAAVEAGILTASSLDLLRRTARVDAPAGAALVPYAGWCAFATALSADIARRNPRPPTAGADSAGTARSR